MDFTTSAHRDTGFDITVPPNEIVDYIFHRLKMGDNLPAMPGWLAPFEHSVV